MLLKLQEVENDKILQHLYIPPESNDKFDYVITKESNINSNGYIENVTKGMMMQDVRIYKYKYDKVMKISTISGVSSPKLQVSKDTYDQIVALDYFQLHVPDEHTCPLHGA